MQQPTPPPPADADVAAAILAAGGVRAYLERAVNGGKALRAVSELAAAADAQAARLRARRDAGAAALRDAAEKAVRDVRARLGDIEQAAADTLAEYDQRRAKLHHFQCAFAERADAYLEHLAVVRCRAVAEAYPNALRPLHALAASGDRDSLGTVAANVARLVEHVQALRALTAPPAAGEEVRKVVVNLENKAVDAVVKARAAFVNILENELRAFGWPMNVPSPADNPRLLDAVNFFVKALDELQAASEAVDFVPPQNRRQAADSTSWSVACLLRAPLQRFRYHFLESHRDQDVQAQTARFDRPEWAADFAMKRIEEATVFLDAVKVAGAISARIKFEAGFASAFASKIALDCELAVRSSQNDSDADALIAHAAATARKFDLRLREISANLAVERSALPSALSVLAANDSFFTGWASSELRLAEAQVGCRLDALLEQGAAHDEATMLRECTELLHIVGDAGAGSRDLNSKPLLHKFLRLTEVPLLQSVRSRLRSPLELCAWRPQAADVFACARAAWTAHVVAECLEDRALDPFYARLEAEGLPLYDNEVEKMRAFSAQATQAVADGIVISFQDGVAEYSTQVADATLPAQDAAVVLAHDLSMPLCAPMTALSDALGALVQAAPNRLVAARIWRDVATRIDAYFTDAIVLRAFTSEHAANPQNAFIKPRHAAKVARQMAFDAHALVNVFDACTAAPANFLPRTQQAGTLLAVAAARVMRPKVAKQGHDEAVRAVLATIDGAALDDAKQAVKDVFDVHSLDVRECLELFAIAGIRKAIPLS